MFDNLTQRLTQTMQKLRGKGRLTEDSIRETLREVRIALLEADVALPVVQSFIGQVRERALGQEVISSLQPGQAADRVQRLAQLGRDHGQVGRSGSEVGEEHHAHPLAVLAEARTVNPGGLVVP